MIGTAMLFSSMVWNILAMVAIAFDSPVWVALPLVVFGQAAFLIGMFARVSIA